MRHPRIASSRLLVMAFGAFALVTCDAELVAGPEPVPTPGAGGRAPVPDRAWDADDTAPQRADEPLADSPGVEPCDAVAFAAVDGAVAEQLEAFADDDWERAYGLASHEYREGVTIDEFVALVQEHFPAVANPAGHASSDCLTDGTRASLLVTVTGRAGTSQTYLYLLIREDDGWRVNGATSSAAREPGEA